MPPESQPRRDVESLRKIRLIGDRRYRRIWGTLTLSALIALAAIGTWGIDFGERPVTFFLGYWGIFLGVFVGVIFIAMLDLWSVRLDYAVKRRDLVRDFLNDGRAAAAPRNGDAAKPPHPL